MATSTASDARALDAAYVWLRTVEHRLQLVEEQQTHTLPAEPAALTHLARVLGFRDTPEVSAVDAFDARHRAQQAVVRAIHEKLFFAPLLDTLAGAGRSRPPRPRNASLRSGSRTSSAPAKRCASSRPDSHVGRA